MSVEGKKVYVSGPMRGYENLNESAFEEAELRLTKLGANVMIPKISRDFDIKKEMKFYLGEIMDKADCLYMLDGWEKSNGSRAEYYLAKSIGLKCFFQNERMGKVIYFKGSHGPCVYKIEGSIEDCVRNILVDYSCDQDLSEMHWGNDLCLKMCNAALGSDEDMMEFFFNTEFSDEGIPEVIDITNVIDIEFNDDIIISHRDYHREEIKTSKRNDINTKIKRLKEEMNLMENENEA